MPLDAVLLSLSLELNDKVLRGVVQSKSTAADKYEDAISDGDSAVLLEQIEPGLYTLNVGNIQPSEKAVIRLKYGQLHKWQGDSLRFYMPTTVAPRYGDPLASGLAQHQVPEAALMAENVFSLVVKIKGELAHSDFNCPTHTIAVSTVDSVKEVSLSGSTALMDRDFVLIIKEPEGSVNEALTVSDQGYSLVLTSFHPTFPVEKPSLSRCIKLVVDCSGSMSGDSIRQAKVALHEILSLLKPNDSFNIIRFGSDFQMLFKEPRIASDAYLLMAKEYVEEINADMGGTEIGLAMEAAYHGNGSDGPSSDLLLITDGEVWDHESVIETARQSGHRVFTVGVGSAVSEGFVRQIADVSSGACELVSPGENMADRIVHHFRRIGQPKSKTVRVEWPVPPVRQIPSKVEAVYAGDTLNIFGWFNEPIAGIVKLTMELENGQTIHQDIKILSETLHHAENGLARIAAYARLPEMAPDQSAVLAEQYQLMTQYTSCVLVYEREESQKAEEVPAIRKVPQVLAAGWGGISSVDCCEFMDTDVDFDLHTFLRRESSYFSHLVEELNDRYLDTHTAKLEVITVSVLTVMGLNSYISEQLLNLIDNGYTERAVVVTFLSMLSDSDYGNTFSRHMKRLIRMAAKGVEYNAALSEAVDRVISD